MSLLQEAWKSYERDVIPATASRLQRQECRRAFYAGQHALLTVMRAMLELDPDAREEALAGIRTEIATFMATVGTTLEGKV